MSIELKIFVQIIDRSAIHSIEYHFGIDSYKYKHRKEGTGIEKRIQIESDQNKSEESISKQNPNEIEKWLKFVSIM
ncbi:hypothetical protein NH340_JMT03526 [Sarcoptes scabiei]|nr:hypothetical protein NH340_JMT03526 [Sarcoptes scabiei]